MRTAATLSRFQDDFARALLAEDPGDALRELGTQPGFAVYRNTVLKGCVDALQANHPSVAALVGEDWMRAAATAYARAHPPRDPRLMLYGEGFAAFLSAFEPARELPYLAGVARLDYAWCEAHVAADGACLSGGELAALPAGVLGATVLQPHPAARWAWFEELPAAAIWRASRDGATDLSGIAWHGGGMLITRPLEAVRYVPVNRGACRFLDACRDGMSLEQAVLAALAAQPEADLNRMMALLVEAGAFAALAASR